MKCLLILCLLALTLAKTTKPNLKNPIGSPRDGHHRRPRDGPTTDSPASNQPYALAVSTPQMPISVTRCELPLAYDVVFSRPSVFNIIEISAISESRPRHIAFEVDRVIVGTLSFPTETNICGPLGNQECFADSIVKYNATLYVPVVGSAVKIWVLHANGNCNQKDSTDMIIIDTRVFGLPVDPRTVPAQNPSDFLPQVAVLSGDILFHGLFDETRASALASGLQVAFATIMPHVHLELISVLDAPIQDSSDPTLRAFHFEIMVLGATDLATFTASLLTESQSAGKLEEVLASMNIHVDGYRMTEITITFDVPDYLFTDSPTPLPTPQPSALPAPTDVVVYRVGILLQGGLVSSMPSQIFSAALGTALQATLHLGVGRIHTGLISFPDPNSIQVEVEFVFDVPAPTGFLDTLRTLADNDSFVSNARRLFPGLRALGVLYAYLAQSSGPYQPEGPPVEDGDDMVAPDDQMTNSEHHRNRRRHLFVAGLSFMSIASLIMACRVCRRTRRVQAIVLPRSRVVTAQVTEVPCIIQSPYKENDHVILLQPIKQV